MPYAYLIQARNWISKSYSWAKVHLSLAEIQRKSDLIAKTIFSIFQISLIIFVGIYLAMVANFILSEQEGILIIPFDTSGMGKDCSGKAVADRLSMEMQKIRGIHEYKQMQINFSKNKTSVAIAGTPLKSSQFIPPIVSTDRSLEKSFSDIGNIDVGPASVSLGQLLLTLRSIAGSSDKLITGSLETYGSNITIVALMEDKSSNKGMLTWVSTMPIESRNLSEEMVPDLINDLAYNIFYDIKDDSQAIGSSKSWISFKHSTEGWNAYRNYNITNEPSYLKRAEEMMRKSLTEDPYNLEAAQLLVVLQSAYQVTGSQSEFSDLTDMALQIPVLSGEAWYNKGISASYDGHWREAADAFDSSVKSDPENKLYWVSKSFALNKLMNKDALAAAEEAIRLDPQYADAWHEKGIALYYQGDYKNSSEAYNLSIELDQSKWWYYHDYALLLWMMGGDANCGECYEEAIKNLDIALKFDLSSQDRTDIISYKEEIIREAK
ncbi:MAG: tetratricopeptide repeat protein, partial [Methanothrix sp.]|nr:tetratricopeptide repeat protein [Methanothrix sp.]